MINLEKFYLPMKPLPSRIYEAISMGVQASSFPPSTDAQRVLGADQPPANEVLRALNGCVLITCVTDMPGVTPAMIDWWFGWHMPSSDRYRLWHPKTHVASRVKEDRSNLQVDRERYLHNVAYVDEYIGGKKMRLAIAFVPPDEFGLHGLDTVGATAICAYTTDRFANGQGGCLVHYVVPTSQGSQMRSAFWLGEITHNVPAIDRLLHRFLNSRIIRRILVSDQMALDLLLHCGEEMSHLARFLPQLYADAHANNDG